MHRSAGHCREIIKANITIGYKKLNVKIESEVSLLLEQKNFPVLFFVLTFDFCMI